MAVGAPVAATLLEGQASSVNVKDRPGHANRAGLSVGGQANQCQGIRLGGGPAAFEHFLHGSRAIGIRTRRDGDAPLPQLPGHCLDQAA
jgi:hypothetical protein